MYTSKNGRATNKEQSVPKMRDYRPATPIGLEPIEASSDSTASLFKIIRDDIISGRLKPNERLVVSELAEKHGTSTNPVREVLQLLRGQGFVLFSPNKGARVRPIDQDYIRDIGEISALVETQLTRWFVSMATEEDVAELERIQDLIEKNNYADAVLHSGLDVEFHTVIYQRHYNHLATEIWWKHREVLRAMGHRYNVTMARRIQVMKEHRALIEQIKLGDAEKAAEIIKQHVEGSARHTLDQMRAATAERAG